MNDTIPIVFSAFLGGVIGFIVWEVALEARWRVRGFLQNRRFNLLDQKRTQILAHKLRNLLYDEQGLPTRMDQADIAVQFEKILAQFSPCRGMFILGELAKRQGAVEQV